MTEKFRMFSACNLPYEIVNDTAENNDISHLCPIKQTDCRKEAFRFFFFFFLISII